MSIKIETGSPLPRTPAGRLALIEELMNTTIKTGKRGRPRKLLTLKDVRKLFRSMQND